MSVFDINNDFIIDHPLPLNIVNDNINKNTNQIVDIELGVKNYDTEAQPRQSYFNRFTSTLKYLIFDNYIAKKIFRY